jgi:tetratricopeptide (TPR) repeat protein
VGRALSEILAHDLEGSPERYVIQFGTLRSFDALQGRPPEPVPGISAQRTNALLAGANRVVYGDFSVVDGMLRANATEEDTLTRHMTAVAGVRVPFAAGIIALGDALARQLGEAHAFSTRNTQALREYVTGLESTDPAASLAQFRRAAAADPDFGLAYLGWFESAATQNNRGDAQQALEQARPFLTRFSPVDRARLQLGAAAFAGDFQARLKALRELERLDPADASGHRALAEALMSVRDDAAALVEFRRALSIRPDDILALNDMGYAAAYSGDLPTAIRVLRAYEQLRPNDPNPLDSLGDVHFVLGHYREAELFYLAAHTKAPAFLNGGELLKAAQARLMTGDIRGGTEIFNRYLRQRQAARDPFAEYYAAGWSWLTGSRRAAIEHLDRLSRADQTGPSREIASHADAQSAIWLLASGDRLDAAEHARKAVAESGPASAAGAALVAFLVEPDKFPAPSQAPLADQAQAYAALFARNFPVALQEVARIYARPTTGLDDGTAVLLAWTYAETGEWQRALPLVRLNPLPQAAGFSMFTSLYFPRLFFLRGALLDRAGHRDEAARNYQIFLSLSGRDSQIWGEEQRARRQPS